MGMLIAGRAVQGAAAGGLILLANICVSDLFDMRSVPIRIWKARDWHFPGGEVLSLGLWSASGPQQAPLGPS